MNTEILIPIIVIFIFSIVQSTFGIGLLVFGTPTMLIFGYSFVETLVYLLPCSLVISFLQFFEFRKMIDDFKYKFPLITLPLVVVGLYVSSTSGSAIGMKLLVGSVLIFSAITRFYESIFKATQIVFRKYQVLYMMLMGIVHGLTNMGGALLAIMVASTHTDKVKVRSNIAYGYFLFSLVQISTLLIITELKLVAFFTTLPVMAASIYIVFNKLIFFRVSEKVFSNAITGFMIFYGFFLIISVALTV